ncbi:MAG: GGDEF domain-containing protein [Oceanospirillaceae bacterium]|nr:GGDEF domain-containing protein [Oceanospirillaceae bacterium]
MKESKPLIKAHFERLENYSFIGLAILTFAAAIALIYTYNQRANDDIRGYFDTQRGIYDELLVERSRRYLVMAMDKIANSDAPLESPPEELDLAYAFLNLGEYTTRFNCVPESLETIDSAREALLTRELPNSEIIGPLFRVLDCQQIVAASKQSDKRILATELLERSEDGRTFSTLIIIVSYSVALFLWLLQINHRRKIQLALAERQAWEERALTDSLTGTLNRGSLNQYLDMYLGGNGQPKRPISLLMYDIDHFKSYNDTFGHVHGDQALIKVTRAIQSVLRADDKQFRFGGEEFVVVTEVTDSTQLAALAERMLNAVRELGLEHPNSNEGIVTLSLGIYVAGSPPYEISDLLGMVDKALYQAKAQGRNQVVIRPAVPSTH